MVSRLSRLAARLSLGPPLLLKVNRGVPNTGAGTSWGLSPHAPKKERERERENSLHNAGALASREGPVPSCPQERKIKKQRKSCPPCPVEEEERLAEALVFSPKQDTHTHTHTFSRPNAPYTTLNSPQSDLRKETLYPNG